MDSLRYWVTEMHVDGFRFDLATTLTRQDGYAEVHSAFLDLIHQDPVLAPIKMIAEPWDTAGYQVGGFPADWSEWNGKFRDDMRDFWDGADSLLGTVAQRVLGSPDVYEASRRSPLSSVNFVTAHDGFTLADLTAYAASTTRRTARTTTTARATTARPTPAPRARPTTRPSTRAATGSAATSSATLLLSAGVPMILGGDEIARTQGGNNNAYCQDDEISWYDWATPTRSCGASPRDLIALRRANPALRPDWYRAAQAEPGVDGEPDTVVLLRSDGAALRRRRLGRPGARTIMFVFTHRDGATPSRCC